VPYLPAKECGPRGLSFEYYFFRFWIMHCCGQQPVLETQWLREGLGSIPTFSAVIAKAPAGIRYPGV
jgi:hypothetical protein